MNKLLTFILCLIIIAPITTHADPTASITAYWKTDESSGNAADATGNGLTLTNHGTMSYGTGKINNGASVVSNSQYLTRASDVIPSSYQNFSVCFWVNVPTTSQGGGFFRVGDPNGSVGFGIGVGNLQYDGSSNGNHVVVLLDGITWENTSENIGTGFHHICVTRGTTTWHVYIDSVVSAKTWTNTPNAANATTYISADQGSFSGVIDEIGVWSQELSQTDINTIYNGGAGIQYPFTSPSKFSPWQFQDF